MQSHQGLSFKEHQGPCSGWPQSYPSAVVLVLSPPCADHPQQQMEVQGQPTLQFSFQVSILCLLPCLGKGPAEVPIKMLQGPVAFFCCHALYPSSLTSCHVSCQTSQPAPCSPSSFPFVCSAFLLSFPWVLFQTFSPIPAAAGSQVSHTHTVCGSWAMLTWGMLSGVSDLHCQPQNASQGNIIIIIIAECQSTGAARAICAFKGHSSAAEIHPWIYVRLAGLYKLPLKVDFFISHFLLHKMFITVVFLPVSFLTAFSITGKAGKLPSSSACCPSASHLSPPCGVGKGPLKGQSPAGPFSLEKKNSHTLSCGCGSCWG